jgi:mycothiol synthase
MARLSNPPAEPGEKPGDREITCRRASAEEVSWALGMILGMNGRPAGAGQVSDFLRHAAQRNIDLTETWAATADGKPLWAILPVISPGKTALLFTPAEILPPNDPPIATAADQLMREVCRELVNRQIHLAQILIDSKLASARQFFRDRQFKEMAELVYLNGSAPRSSRPAILPSELHWETYSPQTHALFAAAIQASYRQSLDCPGLTGMRHIEDVIDGHKATGEFDPRLWRVLCKGTEPMGVLLLSRIVGTDALELVYLGLVPEARGRGWGDLAMQEAMHSVVRENRRRLSLAVDKINTPALKLYGRYGLTPLTSKLAMIRDLRDS